MGKIELDIPDAAMKEMLEHIVNGMNKERAQVERMVATMDDETLIHLYAGWLLSIDVMKEEIAKRRNTKSHPTAATEKNHNKQE